MAKEGKTTKRKNSETNINLSPDINIIVPNDIFTNKENETNKYDERCDEIISEYANIDENIDENKKITNESTITDIKTENKSESKTISSKQKIRKLAIYEKMFLGTLVLLTLIQVLCLAILPFKSYMIYTLIATIFIILLSYGLGDTLMVFVSVIISSISFVIMLQGFNHGMTRKDLSKLTVLNINRLNDLMPVADTYADIDTDTITKYGVSEKYDINDTKLTKKFIYYYKYGCHDCTAIAHKLKTSLQAKDYKVINVETRSKFGKKLLKKYPVTEVPSGLVLWTDKNNKTQHINYILYKKDKNGNDYLDMNNLNKLYDKLDEILTK